MGVLRAYGDESGDTTDEKVTAFAMGALIGEQQHWDDFTEAWHAMLQKHHIEEIHMKHLRNRKHPQFKPFATNVLKMRELLMHALKCITDSELFCCAHTIYIPDFKRVLARHAIVARPYSFSLYHTALTLGTWALNSHPSAPAFHLVMDRTDRGEGKKAEARLIYESSPFTAWRGWPQVTILDPKGERGAPNMPELQAADFITWIVRRQWAYTEEWIRETRPTTRPTNWQNEQLAWLSAKLERDRDPEAALFMAIWAGLIAFNKLELYVYNEEMLEEHVMKERLVVPPGDLVARSIEAAGGPYPLTP